MVYFHAMHASLVAFLNEKAAFYNGFDFIANDPVSIPHRFSKKQDIEIAAFFAAILAWGNRKAIINSCNKLMHLMDDAPYEFIMQINWHESPAYYKKFKSFVHRTFNANDLWHLLNFLQYHFRDQKNESLETAFSKWLQPTDENVENALAGFHCYVFGYSEEAKQEAHCKKHIATPERKSACKRLNMFLRWMVRQDKKGVDFGIWKTIKPSQLVCPLDVHVSRVARKLNLLNRKQDDWLAAIELTTQLKQANSKDPIKYDFALFGLGVIEKFG